MKAARHAFFLALGAAAFGCGAARQATHTPHEGAHVAPSQRAASTEDRPPLGPARAFPPTGRGDVAMEAWEPDGSRRFIAQGVRLVERPGGALEASDQFLPGSRVLQPVELPPRLGGGFVFGVNAGSEGLLWRGAAWTAPLEPLARLDGEIERVVPGFDRLYVLRARGAPWIALDVDSGQALELGSLPPSPSYGAMLFADEWLGVVSVPLRGVLATFDAGGTWHPLGFPTATLASDDAGVRIDADGRRYLLGAGGSLAPLATAESTPAESTRAATKPGSDATRAPDAKPARLRAPEPLGPRPLETAVLHGLPAADGTALVATRGVLARVRLQDGAVLDVRDDAYGGRAPCDGVALGAGSGFVCGEPHGPTTIYALAPGLELVPAWTFAEPRRVAPNGRGDLVVDGSCKSRGARVPSRCVILHSGASFEWPVRSPDERAVALTDGRLALITPRPASPKKSATGRPPEAHPGARKPPEKTPDQVLGTLTLVRPGSAEQTLALKLGDVEDEAARALVNEALWLDSFEQAPNGELRGWVAGAQSFAGVRVKLDGRVVVGAPEPHLERASLSGRFGLVVGRARSVRETVDGGFEWTDAELPAEPDLRLEKTYGAEHGCSALGCALGGWLRVGWTAGDPRAALPPAPEPTRLLGSGGNRWSLECTPTGEQSRPALRQLPQPDDRSVSPWNALAEVAAPPRGRADTAYEIMNEADLRLFHAYAWGPSGDGWQRDARFVVRVRDPYRVTDSIWSTAPSPSVWSSAVLAADAFGRSSSGPPATWRVVTDPTKHAGLLLVSSKGTLDFYLLEENRPITRLKTSGAVGIVTSVAFAGGRFFVSALGENRSLRLYRVEAGVLEPLGEFPDINARAEPPTLAPATQGDGIGVWVHDADFYLFPFDQAARRFDPPLVTRARDMASMPAACTTGEDGYVVGDALSLEPNVDLQGVSAGTSTGNGIEVRLIVGPSRRCTDAVSAPLGSRSREAHPMGLPTGRARTPAGARTPGAKSAEESPPHGVSERDESPGVELVLASPDGSRKGFRCRD